MARDLAVLLDVTRRAAGRPRRLLDGRDRLADLRERGSAGATAGRGRCRLGRDRVRRRRQARGPQRRDHRGAERRGSRDRQHAAGGGLPHAGGRAGRRPQGARRAGLVDLSGARSRCERISAPTLVLAGDADPLAIRPEVLCRGDPGRDAADPLGQITSGRSPTPASHSPSSTSSPEPPSMSLGEVLAIALAGLAAGTINTVVGSGTLITFPVLLAFGYAPVTANVSNTDRPGAGVGSRGRSATGASSPASAGARCGWARRRCWAASPGPCCCWCCRRRRSRRSCRSSSRSRSSWSSCSRA